MLRALYLLRKGVAKRKYPKKRRPGCQFSSFFLVPTRYVGMQLRRATPRIECIPSTLSMQRDKQDKDYLCVTSVKKYHHKKLLILVYR
jgi:hypothetical protein